MSTAIDISASTQATETSVLLTNKEILAQKVDILYEGQRIRPLIPTSYSTPLKPKNNEHAETFKALHNGVNILLNANPNGLTEKDLYSLAAKLHPLTEVLLYNPVGGNASKKPPYSEVFSLDSKYRDLILEKLFIVLDPAKINNLDSVDDELEVALEKDMGNLKKISDLLVSDFQRHIDWQPIPPQGRIRNLFDSYRAGKIDKYELCTSFVLDHFHYNKIQPYCNLYEIVSRMDTIEGMTIKLEYNSDGPSGILHSLRVNEDIQSLIGDYLEAVSSTFLNLQALKRRYFGEA